MHSQPPECTPGECRNPGIPRATQQTHKRAVPKGITKRKKSRLSHTQRQDTQSHKRPELTRSLTHSDRASERQTSRGAADLQGQAVGETISNIPRGTPPPGGLCHSIRRVQLPSRPATVTQSNIHS